MLNDQTIRSEFKSHLLRRANKPRILVEELRIHDGNAIADIVAIYDFMHGYEIKGESDKVSRITVQSGYYNTSFSYLTLITTENHLQWAIENIDSFWGIIVAFNGGTRIKFRHIRGAKSNPLFSTKKSLSMLWRDELMNVGTIINQCSIRKNDSRSVLADKITTLLNKSKAVELLSSAIIKRYSDTLKDESHVSA
jgi:hypothetical protein